ncbi:hypothetical protein [Methylobacterium platani]|uniref:Uncharacterized protein n=2 Tax=Methylobacterium platani TaxID=427683 RepID=A0A179RT58_9HYPH|nr:hypothetical protein [Methylobacterium platani]KMO16246.1 hypothetical protein SQ03_15030 [Methylobacterium platani JCM 14648]OAS11908.1 hypothetical protein A5481_31655 [Methylobacterium platani]
MNATARFEWPVRPDRIEVSSRGYLAAAILLSDLRAARTPPSATVHRLVPRRARPRPAPAEGLRRVAEA